MKDDDGFLSEAELVKAANGNTRPPKSDREPTPPIAYEVSNEMEDMLKSLKAKHHNVFWHVDPTVIRCLLITNREWKESQPIAKISAVRGVNKELIHYRYVMIAHADKWDSLFRNKKLYVVAHEMLHIGEECDGKLAKHEVQDFYVMLRLSNKDFKNPMDDDKLPDLLDNDTALI